MARLHVFADEAGTFDFRSGPNISNYFIVCTVVMPSCDAAAGLLNLRRKLAWEGREVGHFFHASEDRQNIRDEVFQEIIRHQFTIQATIMEKRKARPHIRSTNDLFYKHGWFQHFRWGMTEPLRESTEVHVTAASVATKKAQVGFEDAVRDVLRQTGGKKTVKPSFWKSETDPCLQIADYCTWAIQRKWEKKDTRSYEIIEIIEERITYEYDVFKKGTDYYY